jgi:hypothetical protein
VRLERNGDDKREPDQNNDGQSSRGQAVPASRRHLPDNREAEQQCATDESGTDRDFLLDAQRIQAVGPEPQRPYTDGGKKDEPDSAEQ